MTLAEACATSLAPELSARGLEIGQPDGPRLPVPSLSLDIIATDATPMDGGGVSVTFDARPLDSTDAGIRVLAVGNGEGHDAAAADAARQWSLGVLPVLISYLLREHVCEVEKSPMLVGVADSTERFGWTVHLGPVIGKAYGRQSDEDVSLGDLSRLAAYQPVFHTIHPHAAHQRLMWVESFAARYFRDRKVDATCRLNNRDFAEGREALLDWATSWPDCEASMLSKRQFLLFESTPPEALGSSGDLSGHLDQAMAQQTLDTDSTEAWWRRLWRRLTRA